MYKIDSTGTSLTLPTPLTTGITPGFFAQTTSSSTIPTVVSADFLNMAMMEICNVCTAGGQTLSKTTYTQLRDAILVLISQSARIKVTANLHFYVATSGSDTLNNGMTVGAPFLTIQHAVDVVYRNYDWNGFGATVHIANGTYTQPVNVYGQPLGHGLAAVTFVGNTASPTAVVISVTNNNAWVHNIGSWAILQGITFAATGTATTTIGLGYGLLSMSGCYVEVQNCNFASCTTCQCTAANGGMITFDSLPSSFTGTSGFGINAGQAGQIWMQNSVFTMSATYNNAFAISNNCGIIICGGANSFPGTTTGPKYSVGFNGVINLQGVTLPGSSAGVATTGGQVS